MDGERGTAPVLLVSSHESPAGVSTPNRLTSMSLDLCRKRESVLAATVATLVTRATSRSANRLFKGE